MHPSYRLQSNMSSFFEFLSEHFRFNKEFSFRQRQCGFYFVAPPTPAHGMPLMLVILFLSLTLYKCSLLVPGTLIESQRILSPANPSCRLHFLRTPSSPDALTNTRLKNLPSLPIASFQRLAMAITAKLALYHEISCEHPRILISLTLRTRFGYSFSANSLLQALPGAFTINSHKPISDTLETYVPGKSLLPPSENFCVGSRKFVVGIPGSQKDLQITKIQLQMSNIRSWGSRFFVFDPSLVLLELNFDKKNYSRAKLIGVDEKSALFR